jgi:sulfide:quinone oxidoreductase
VPVLARPNQIRLAGVGAEESSAGSGGSNRPRVVIAGGGIAGLEALMALSDLAGDRVAITLVAPEPDFVYKPLIVEEPFSLTPAERHELAPLTAEFGAEFVQQGLAAVDPGARAAELADGSRLDYQFLIVCAGARGRAPFEGAITLTIAGEPPSFADLVPHDVERGEAEIAFVVPPGVSWPLPVYELALMARREAERRGLGDLRITVVTPEAAPLILFGPAASDAVVTLLEARGIEVVAGAHAHQRAGGELVLTPGDRPLAASRVVTMPVLEGRRISGLPGDENGFIPIDQHARVAGMEDVYAAGDGTNFPIKQGGLGTQQADAAAEHIAARAGAELDPQPFHPVLRGKLLTGEESLDLQQDLTGGSGEGVASLDYLWWPPHKVSGRYLAAWLAHETPHADPAPPRHPLDVEVALPREWHREPMALDPYEPPS